MISSIQQPARSVPVLCAYDVLIVGGGPAGVIAALAASGSGLSVGLIESRSFLGGNLTLGLPVLGFLSQKGKPIIAGLPQKFIDRLKAIGAASDHRPCPLHMSLTLVEPEAVKSVALQMLVEAGVHLHLYTFLAGVVMQNDGSDRAGGFGETALPNVVGAGGLGETALPAEGGNHLQGVITESKAGRQAILAKIVIDCTGDADVAFRSGVPTEKGDESGGMQPPTLMFCMAGVDTEKLRLSLAHEPKSYLADIIPPDYFGRNRQYIVVGLRRLLEQAQHDGLSIPTERTIIITGLRQGEAWINMTRVRGVDGTDPASLTRGEIEARRQIQDIEKYLVGYVPGFENAHFTKAAPFLGIRETRRIVGHYVMTRGDILSCRRFDDAIAAASYPIDLHRPHDAGCTLEWCGDCYDIPFRSLLPRGVDNLLVAGRCISTTHEAMAAIRVMATCMAIGEAAGRAAAMAVSRRISPAALDVSVLRQELLRHGAFLRPPEAAKPQPMSTGPGMPEPVATAEP